MGSTNRIKTEHLTDNGKHISITAGGIVIPDSATEKPIKGEVIAVGDGKALDNGSTRAPKVKVGDKVLFGKYAGTEVKLDGVEYSGTIMVNSYTNATDNPGSNALVITDYADNLQRIGRIVAALDVSNASDVASMGVSTTPPPTCMVVGSDGVARPGDPGG